MSKINLSDKISIITGLFTIIGGVVFALYFLATKEDVAQAMQYTQKVEQRLDQKIEADAELQRSQKILEFSQQIWVLEDRYKDYEDVSHWPNEKDKEWYRILQFKIDQLKSIEDDKQPDGE